MGQPTPFVRSFDFTDFSEDSPAAQQPGVRLDAEYDAIKLTLDEILRNLVLLQRDDGQLGNGVVKLASLHSEVLAAIALAGIEVEAWATAQVYAVGQVLTSDDDVYLVAVAHTSGVLATDVAANRLIRVFDSGILADLLDPAQGARLVGFETGRSAYLKLRALEVDVQKEGVEFEETDPALIADASAVIQGLYDDLADGLGGRLIFPRGRYKVGLNLTSRIVHLKGEGDGATILYPTADDGVILRGLFREASWRRPVIEGFTFKGAGTREGRGYVAGADVYADNDEYSGVALLQHNRFDNLERCIERRQGNIGLWIDHSYFIDCDYALWARSRAADDPMHAGCLDVRRSRFDAWRKALCYIDGGAIGAAQVRFEGNVIENGPGFVFYLKGVGGAAVPGFRAESNYVEPTGVASGTNINVEGVVHANARFLYAESCPHEIVFVNTLVASAELVDASVRTEDCPIDGLVLVKDAASSISHRRPHLFTGTTAGRVTEHASPTNCDASLADNQPVFRSPPDLVPAPLATGTLKLGLTGEAPISFTGSAAVDSTPVADDGMLPGSRVCQQLVLTAGQNFHPTTTFSFTTLKWQAVIIGYRVTAGTATVIVTGSDGLSGAGALDSSEWEVLSMILYNGGATAATEWVEFASVAGATIRFDVIQSIEFDTKQQALDYVNSRRCVLPAKAGTLGFSNSWVTFGGASAIQLNKAGGIVHLSGAVKDGTTTAGTLMMTLPVGYRPTRALVHPASSAGAIKFIGIAVNGQVTAIDAMTASDVHINATFPAY